MILRRSCFAVSLLLATTALTDARNAQTIATDCGGFMRNIRQSEGSGDYSTNTAQSARSCDFGQLAERCGNTAWRIDPRSARS